MTNPHITDLSGRLYGRWTVIHRDGSHNGQSIWRCRCICGVERSLRISSLRNGSSTSCGCLAKELLATRSTTHGLSKHPLHRTWARMKDRCFNKESKYYVRYGGRGIKVCERWMSFMNFYDDTISTWDAALSLDRIDNDGPYSPENCRWTDDKTQSRNRRNVTSLTVNGETKLFVEWAEIIGISAPTLRARERSGWPADKIISNSLWQRNIKNS